MSNSSGYQPFVAVSGKLEGKVPVVDNVLLSHEQKFHPTTSLDENCREFEFQTDRKYYVDMRQSYLASKLKFVKSHGYEIFNSKEVQKENKEEIKESVAGSLRRTEDEELERRFRFQFLSILM